VHRFATLQPIECPDRFGVVAERHLNLLNREFQRWYNYERPHSAREYLPPVESATVKLKDVGLRDATGRGVEIVLATSGVIVY